MKESDLYAPIRDLFKNMGYDVKAEVKDVDMVAIKDDLIIMFEFKLSLEYKLVLQAVNRQKMTELVYVAIPKPTSRVLRSKSFKEKIHLLRRLELGLIYVTTDKQLSYAQIIEEPRPYNRKTSISRNKRKKNLIVKEMKDRHSDYNVGGSKGKVITVYKEQCLWLAYHLIGEPTSPKILKEQTGIEKTANMLQRNFYNWFQRVDRGVYTLSQEGRLAVEEYAVIISLMKSAKEAVSYD